MPAEHLIPRKTPAARQLLQASRQALSPGLRMLLITVDGHKSLAELKAFAQGLGLTDAAFQRLSAEGLIAWGEETTVDPRAAERTKSLVRAKLFAMDLAARMLAGQDRELRELARRVDSESAFHAWLDECAGAIAQAGSAERAALFRERVAAAA